MIRLEQLRIPGPTPLPMRVIRASGRPMINPRSEEFSKLLAGCVSELQRSLLTQNDVLLFPASGTGGLEAAVANMVSPGERVLVCVSGWFGAMWADMCSGFGADTVRLEVAWGRPVDPARIDEILADDPRIRTVFVTHNETSTGVTNDMAAIAAVVKGSGRLLVVDSISGAGCLPLAVDELDLDIVVTASQKGWLAPPGLTMVAVSPAALEKASTTTCSRWYFDFPRQKRAQDRGESHTTPPLSVLYALNEGLTIRSEEGVNHVLARHRRIARIVRAGLAALRLELYAAPPCQSDTVTAVCSPFSTRSHLSEFLQHLRTRCGLVLAEGIGPLYGRIFRVGHMGDIDDEDAYDILDRLQRGLALCGHQCRSDLALAAAQHVLENSTPSAGGTAATSAGGRETLTEVLAPKWT